MIYGNDYRNKSHYSKRQEDFNYENMMRRLMFSVTKITGCPRGSVEITIDMIEFYKDKEYAKYCNDTYAMFELCYGHASNKMRYKYRMKYYNCDDFDELLPAYIQMVWFDVTTKALVKHMIKTDKKTYDKLNTARCKR